MPSAPKKPYTIHVLAEKVKMGRSWVENRLAKSDFTAIVRKDGLRVYSGECLKWLRQEAVAWRRLPALGGHFSLQQAADQLACTRPHVIKLVERHNLPVEKRRSKNNRAVICVSPATLKLLKDLRCDIAPLDFYNIYQLSLATGWPCETAKAKLLRGGLEPTRYRSGESGQVHDYYPAEAREILGIRPNHRYPAGGYWMTAHRIECRLGRGYRWTTERLKPYAMSGRIMLDDSGIPRTHYPPTVYYELKQLSETQGIGRAA